MFRLGRNLFCIFAVFAAMTYGQESDALKGEAESSAAGDSGGGAILPTAVRRVEPKRENPGVEWRGLAAQSLKFLVIEHTFRFATERGTRSGMKGPFFPTYLD